MKKDIFLILSAAAFLAGSMIFAGCDNNSSSVAETARVYSNPLYAGEADPWVYHHTDSYYYYTATESSFTKIIVHKASTINGLRTSGESTMINASTLSGWGCYSYIWAPELHYINGAWFVFFSASNTSSSVWSIRQYVAKCLDTDPASGTWEFVGQVAPGTINSFCVDGTVFQNTDGQWYYVWSQDIYDGGSYDEDGSTGVSGIYSITVNGTVYPSRANTNKWSCIFIGKTNPDDFTKVTSPAIISIPHYTWECTGKSSASVNVNEGPAILQRNGKVFIVYSASACDESYCLGLLSAGNTADLCSMSSWTKSDSPVFKTCEANSAYGPGHCSFTTDGDDDVIVYHARGYSGLYTSYDRSKSTTDGLSDPFRSPRAKVFTWNTDGTPNFGQPE
jgi:GH43 family beta-xylosidase